MAKTEKELREEIVEIGKLMYQKGWVANNDGNMTVRIDADSILSTPANVSKGMMNPDDQVMVDMMGNKIHGRRERTSEIDMHLMIYRMRADVQSVVHAHPPVSTGFASAGRALDVALLPEVVLCLGCVPLAPYGLPGTNELSEAIQPFIVKYDAVLMQNHGVVTCGNDLYNAFFRMETVEHFARIALVAEVLGGAKPLTRVEVDKLFKSRSRYGIHSNAGPELGQPLVAEDFESGLPSTTASERRALETLLDENVHVNGS
jgi:L-fuculose-phosphate aldolase